MSTLTEQQIAEVVEAMARAAARMVPTSAGNWIEPHGHDFPRQYSPDEVRRIRSLFATALTAALPVIERAVLERAAALLDEHGWKFDGWGEAANAIRALVEEVK